MIAAPVPAVAIPARFTEANCKSAVYGERGWEPRSLDWLGQHAGGVYLVEVGVGFRKGAVLLVARMHRGFVFVAQYDDRDDLADHLARHRSLRGIDGVAEAVRLLRGET